MSRNGDFSFSKVHKHVKQLVRFLILVMFLELDVSLVRFDF